VALLLATAIKPHGRRLKEKPFCGPEVGAQQLQRFNQRIERSWANSAFNSAANEAGDD